MTFPLPDGALLIVIEPGNIERLKEGRPLKVGQHAVCFTPDLVAFSNKLLGVDVNVNPGVRVELDVKVTPEQLQAALDACKDLPEVVR